VPCIVIISEEESNTYFGIMSYLPLPFYEVKKMRRGTFIIICGASYNL